MGKRVKPTHMACRTSLVRRLHPSVVRHSTFFGFVLLFGISFKSLVGGCCLMRMLFDHWTFNHQQSNSQFWTIGVPPIYPLFCPATALSVWIKDFVITGKPKIMMITKDEMLMMRGFVVGLMFGMSFKSLVGWMLFDDPSEVAFYFMTIALIMTITLVPSLIITIIYKVKHWRQNLQRPPCMCIRINCQGWPCQTQDNGIMTHIHFFSMLFNGSIVFNYMKILSDRFGWGYNHRWSTGKPLVYHPPPPQMTPPKSQNPPGGVI